MKSERSIAIEPSTDYGKSAFAILHSSFEEVLFLDADNTPVRDPSLLFNYDEFRKGDLFWPDCNHQGQGKSVIAILEQGHYEAYEKSDDADEKYQEANIGDAA